MQGTIADLADVAKLAKVPQHTVKHAIVTGIYSWTALVLNFQLASFTVPDLTCVLVNRVESFMVNETAGATDLFRYSAPPSGNVYWGVSYGGTLDQYTKLLTSNGLLDAEQFYVFNQGARVVLFAEWNAPPDATVRKVKTHLNCYILPAYAEQNLRPMQTMLLGV